MFFLERKVRSNVGGVKSRFVAGWGDEESGGGRWVWLSCPVISCHINIVDLLITGEYHAAEVGSSL